MDYNKLISVTGLSGLYELVSSKADGGIVRSLEDKSTKFVSNRIHSFSHLETIEVFTKKDNVNLTEVFTSMKNSSEVLPSDKDAAAIKKYFEKVYPEMDFERVYASDMKKMVKWYASLVANNVDIKLSDMPEQDTAAPAIDTPVTKAKPTTNVKAASNKNVPAKK
ncbi:MAG: DUF5606 domain-containing protein [Chitinophagaceae bacterium]|nr:DUF5606 domain-containing protein [Chitinophagaceae bacterium]